MFVLQSYQLFLMWKNSFRFTDFNRNDFLIIVASIIGNHTSRVENTETQGARLCLFTADDQPFFDGKKANATKTFSAFLTQIVRRGLFAQQK